MQYWEYDPDLIITCPDCGWSGRAGDVEEPHRELLDVCCGVCDAMLLIVQYPTVAETNAAAAAGNQRAVAELAHTEAVAVRARRASASQLGAPDELPELPGDDIRIDWDFVQDADGERWTVLRHDGVEIWREYAFYEGYERFAEVFEILHQRYGVRLIEVCPTGDSEYYLYGDALRAPQIISDLNASLRGLETAETTRSDRQNPISSAEGNDCRGASDDVEQAVAAGKISNAQEQERVRVVFDEHETPHALGMDIARRLEALMRERTQFIIFERTDGRNYYIQCLPTPNGELYCEAVSNQYLAAEHQLTGEQESEMTRLGWSSPTPNFARQWDEPIPFADVGQTLARTFHRVYGGGLVSDVGIGYGPLSGSERGQRLERDR